ncbi:kinase-like domain-containing protein [Aspergillus parasiticus]|uniref:Kinase-like domain-containing protein n=1 Tax=Aspergillus parasiticus TaxID=5067 RepID=A0A5N6DB99_ASPPA|nr:kinase-like domain-containing protein [Aspergillus parasiticus]
MSGVGEGIAIASIIVEGTKVVGEVVRFVIEVKHFKRECAQVRDDCVLVLELMRKNKSKKVEKRTLDRITSCFEEARLFLHQCAEDWGWFHASVEVMFRRKHQSLKEELKWATSIFTIDVLTELLAGQERQQASDQQLYQSLEAGFSGIEAELRSISREVVKLGSGLGTPPLNQSIRVFRERDLLLRPNVQLGMQFVDGIKGFLDIPGAGDVQLYETVGENSAQGLQLPRMINIYSRISQRTAARTFWGIFEHSNKKYAVMESLEGHSRLEDALSSGDFVKVDLVGRLRFAWEICNAVAYFHSVNILLKSLSSQSVYIRPTTCENDHIRPILTDVENARLITESTVEQEFDVRFEARDFHIEKQKFHTVYTDIWSLGVFLHCCITGKQPFGVSPPGDSITKANVRGQLRDPKCLYESPEIKELPKIQQILKCCFQSPAHLRPSASSVSNVFLEAFTEISYKKSLSLSFPKETTELLAVKEQCYNMIKQARRQNHEHTDKPQMVSATDLDLLVKHGEADATSSDPPCSFLIGALVWWDLIENSQQTDIFGITDKVSRARVTINKLLLASAAGFLDGDLELSEAYKYLARNYKMNYSSRKELLNEDKTPS